MIIQPHTGSGSPVPGALLLVNCGRTKWAPEKHPAIEQWLVTFQAMLIASTHRNSLNLGFQTLKKKWKRMHGQQNLQPAHFPCFNALTASTTSPFPMLKKPPSGHGNSLNVRIHVPVLGRFELCATEGHDGQLPATGFEDARMDVPWRMGPPVEFACSEKPKKYVAKHGRYNMI